MLLKIRIILALSAVILAVSCEKDGADSWHENPEIKLNIPAEFPDLNRYMSNNWPTVHGVELGEALFHENKLSGNQTISCGSCHQRQHAFASPDPQAMGVEGRVGLRNVPPLQNLAFMRFYNWDGNLLDLQKQVLVPIVTHEEMDARISQVILRLQQDQRYPELFRLAFGDAEITADRIYRSIAQYEYTLISADSKYDRVMRKQGEQFTALEAEGFRVFQKKCVSCHSGPLFTDESFRNIGFPLHTDPEEAGRARVTGDVDDYMRFRVPSLRNVAFTAPYGSFGQFSTLEELLVFMDRGVIDAHNLDPVFKENNNRIPLSKSERAGLIAFLNTLSDTAFVAN